MEERSRERHAGEALSKGARHGSTRLDHSRPRRRRDRQGAAQGREPGGLLGTLVVGIAGALVGGFIASAVGIGGISSFFSLGTWLIAIGGALLLLVIYSTVTGGSRSTTTTG
jgi:uncharacterized membrane protein YeaQ/YmgE (transglycosylase-associated protein family)